MRYLDQALGEDEKFTRCARPHSSHFSQDSGRNWGRLRAVRGKMETEESDDIRRQRALVNEQDTVHTRLCRAATGLRTWPAPAALSQARSSSPVTR